MDLTIVTALSLLRPQPGSDLEQRLLTPMSHRLFGDYPTLEYARDLRAGNLPDNVTVNEFYFQPGSMIGNLQGQQNYVSTNYTHAVRDTVQQGVNVLAQLVTPKRYIEEKNEAVHSLSCNADLTFDMLDVLEEKQGGEDSLFLGEVNDNLPFMHGETYVPPAKFDGILNSEGSYELFSTPSPRVSEVDYAIGLHASRLIEDGGTLQIGIGSLSDALTRMLIARHRRNQDYTEAHESFEYPNPIEDLVDRIGGNNPFEKGLYASTEMFVRGFEELLRAGVLSREVFDNTVIQKYVNQQDQDPNVSLDLLDQLRREEVIADRIKEDDVNFLKSYGIIKNTIEFDDDLLILHDGETVGTNLDDQQVRDVIKNQVLGDSLKDGVLAHAGFFLGPTSLYSYFRDLDDNELKQIRMSRISFVNNLYENEELKRAQRQSARFLNSAMKVTLSGGVVSDGLENMQVVSGVGGQYNFVAMAHELEDGRSIIMLPSTRESDGEVESNIVWNYGHMTIPRHLRDIVVTEYGIADLRGCTDRQIIEELLSITDARFQDQLIKKAREAGKIPSDWTLPDEYRSNTPEKINRWFKKTNRSLDLSGFPFGTKLTEEEQVIGKALRKVKSKFESWDLNLNDVNHLSQLVSVTDRYEKYLDRMNLQVTEKWSEYYSKLLLILGLQLVEEDSDRLV